MLAAVDVVHLPAWLAFIAGLLAVLTTAATAVAVVRQVSIKTTLVTLEASLHASAAANVELRLTNDDLKKALDEEREKRAKLEGRLDAFTTHLARELVDAVVRTVREVTPNLGPTA